MVSLDENATLKNTVGGLAALGFVVLFRIIWNYARLLLSLFVLSGTKLSKYGKKGTWAIVTGASDGIGKEYAVQLARGGFDVLLVSRTESKLQHLCSDIENKYPGRKTKYIAMDFAENLDADYAELQAVIDTLDVGILVNNVGKSHEMPVPFVQTPSKEMKDIMTINCIGTLRVTQMVAPSLIRRKNGLIITMGSFAGLLPTPLLATYSGSKAFLQFWSTALGSELKPHGVDVELITSYLVTSAMSKIRRPSAFVPTPRTYVKSVLSSIGRSGGAQGYAYTATPYWGHAIMQWALVTFVGVFNTFVVQQNYVMHQSIRKRALQKAERDSKKAL
ncbi:MAG: hypothetical protein M1814_001637 [Vezdaea aestivalis]|nr:MAG: hypothetical protein M1814_001637 [Vezdaea aestivalis]